MSYRKVEYMGSIMKKRGNDWLGNVRVVVNDKKTLVNTGTVTVSYVPQVINVRDYYSFGLEINERTYSYFNTKYRFSFNDKEDIEQRWYQDYGARYYHKALGRFISADPIIINQHKYTFYSPYQFAGNKPIVAIDLDGLEDVYYQEKLKNSFGFQMAQKVLNSVEAHQQFLKALQNQNKYDVYYRHKVTGNYGETMVLSNKKELYKGLSEDEAKQLSHIFDKNKQLIVITIDLTGLDESFVKLYPDILKNNLDQDGTKKYNNMKVKLAEVSEAITHEEWAHGLSILKGKKSNVYKEHKKLYGGEYIWFSPSLGEILKEEYYKDTPAFKILKDIVKQVDKLFPRGNQTQNEIIKQNK